ncbi:hypothetical protein IWQ62_002902 [Dispira parvispora]|uniref:Cyclin-like domain-containing protein n=1 Tax=Dispira parvispora TaxID=1520584 RepID=A0A9W8AUS9_9FUNG|nr:hypothetical protein IWQ62_002902 [Dispira parvispora]
MDEASPPSDSDHANLEEHHPHHNALQFLTGIRLTAPPLTKPRTAPTPRGSGKQDDSHQTLPKEQQKEKGNGQTTRNEGETRSLESMQRSVARELTVDTGGAHASQSYLQLEAPYHPTHEEYTFLRPPHSITSYSATRRHPITRYAAPQTDLIGEYYEDPEYSIQAYENPNAGTLKKSVMTLGQGFRNRGRTQRASMNLQSQMLSWLNKDATVPIDPSDNPLSPRLGQSLTERDNHSAGPLYDTHAIQDKSPVETARLVFTTPTGHNPVAYFSVIPYTKQKRSTQPPGTIPVDHTLDSRTRTAHDPSWPLNRGSTQPLAQSGSGHETGVLQNLASVVPTATHVVKSWLRTIPKNPYSLGHPSRMLRTDSAPVTSRISISRPMEARLLRQQLVVDRQTYQQEFTMTPSFSVYEHLQHINAPLQIDSELAEEAQTTNTVVPRKAPATLSYRRCLYPSGALEPAVNNKLDRRSRTQHLTLGRRLSSGSSMGYSIYSERQHRKSSTRSIGTRSSLEQSEVVSPESDDTSRLEPPDLRRQDLQDDVRRAHPRRINQLGSRSQRFRPPVSERKASGRTRGLADWQPPTLGTLAFHYDPNYLDDPELKTGSRRTVVKLAGFVGSIVQHTQPAELKRELNDLFRQKHGADVDPTITLSKIRSLKHRLIQCAQQVDCELSSVAKAFVYLEKLLLLHQVHKDNRRCIAAACLLLAVKVNEPHDKRIMQLLSTMHKILGVPPAMVLQHEFSVFASLQFELYLPIQEFTPHLNRILHSVGLDTLQEYMGNDSTFYLG